MGFHPWESLPACYRPVGKSWDLQPCLAYALLQKVEGMKVPLLLPLSTRAKWAAGQLSAPSLSSWPTVYIVNSLLCTQR